MLLQRCGMKIEIDEVHAHSLCSKLLLKKQQVGSTSMLQWQPGLDARTAVHLHLHVSAGSSGRPLIMLLLTMHAAAADKC